MSLGNSNYTYFTLREAGPDVFKAEVDRFVKDIDNEVSNCPSSSDGGRKRARHDDTLESGYGSQTQPPIRALSMSGVILDVNLENFLCHEKFNISLNKRLNFIIGSNGSGKSAILTGIIVALGGNANATGRGSSLKDFVKYDCQSARVTVSVSNAGALNFRKEQYGNKIIVSRTIDNQGRSKVELKSEQGKTISTKMQDLRGMCLKLGIQVDNPISILDQNTAKTFLLQNKPGDLYHLFMKASDLETLRLLHEEIDRLQKQTDQEIRKKKRDLENNNAELVEVKRKYEILKSFEKDKAKEDLLKLELLKAQARDYQSDVQNAQKVLEEAGTERMQLETISSTNESEILHHQLEEESNNLRQLSNQQEEVENNIKTMNIRYLDNVKEEKSCELDLKQLEVKMKHNEHMMTEYKAEIISLENKLQPSHVENKKKIEDEMALLQQTVKQCEDYKTELKGKLLNLQESLNNRNDALVDLQAQEKRLQKTLVEEEKALKGLKEDQSSFSRFGKDMGKLTELIEKNSKAGKFKRKPVGPIGSFVRVKDSKWVLAVETAIKPRIDSFVVENLEDEKLLQSLIKTIYTRGPKPGVLRCRFIEQPIDTTMTSARTSEHPNILDMIEVSNTIVRNTLVEVLKVESTLLIPTDDECYFLLKDSKTVPRNCTKAFILSGASYFPAPRYSTYCARQSQARILEVSQQTLIEGMTDRINKLKDQLKDIKIESNSVSCDIQKTRKCIKESKTDECKNMEKLLQITTRLEKLKDLEVPDTHSISTLKEDLAERERKHLEFNSIFDKHIEKIENLQREKEELKNRGTEFKERLNTLGKLRQPIIKKKKELNEQIENLRRSQTNSAKRIDEIKKQEEQQLLLIKNLEDTYYQKNQDAEKFESHLLSEGINLQEISNIERNQEIIDAELKKVMKRRAGVEKSFGQSIDVVEREYYETFALHDQVQTKIKTLTKNSMYLKKAIENRLSLYIIQRRYAACVASHQFTRVLLQRNCIGNIKVDFDKKLISINVGPIDGGNRAGLGTSSLSGGERTYATAAFVIALWNLTELPFYYLDEFDVFMDVITRQTVMTLLLKFARQKRGYQFGFLTPLNTTAITESDDLSIWKLDDPRSS